MRLGTALVLLALFVLPACRRVDPDAIVRAKAELAGAWLRESNDEERRVEGFDLRADGSVGLLGNDARNGIAWNRMRDELVISTNGEHDARPHPSRMQIAALDGDRLELRGDASEHFAGSYRRTPIEHVTGVVTYLERVALPADARVEVRLTRGDERVARSWISPREPVPIPFALSLLPATAGDAGGYALEASIVAGGTILFATPATVPIESGASDVELVLRPPSEAR